VRNRSRLSIKILKRL